MSATKKKAVRVKQDEFALQCFVNGRRKLTKDLTREEAFAFLQDAMHLAAFLAERIRLER